MHIFWLRSSQHPVVSVFKSIQEEILFFISFIARRFSIVIFFQIFPDSAAIHLFGDVDVDVRRDGDLDDVAVGHGNLDPRRGVPQAVTRPSVEFVFFEKILKAKESKKMKRKLSFDFFLENVRCHV